MVYVFESQGVFGEGELLMFNSNGVERKVHIFSIDV